MFKIYDEPDSPSKGGMLKICDEQESPNEWECLGRGGLRQPPTPLRFLKPCKVA